ncbi:MAG: CAT RNA binding domain-containing protein, partial [Lachnospiraceae bacterium]|nr:CAT RNA binding domain-containing protein [Lachnospiraceae bacterium]
MVFFNFIMIIEKIINNNVVIANSDNGKETVVMGKGIGFQAKAGQRISEEKIEKRFVLDSKSDTGRFGELVQSIPLEHFEVCMKIIDYAMQVMQR